MSVFGKYIILVGVAAAGATGAWADDSPAGNLVDQLSQSISKQYPGAQVTVDPQLRWTRAVSGDALDGAKVTLLGETSRGEMMFTVTDSQGHRVGEGWASYTAWAPARVAIQRIHPGDKLSADSFTVQNVNVAAGQAHELRGVILDTNMPLVGLEARQSVLEGEMLLSTAVQRIPDVRRGDAVIVQIISNGLSLSTQGVAEEPAYTGGSIKITASKTKRELVGKLLAGGTVEVRL